jgi:AraC family transcriptional regulator
MQPRIELLPGKKLVGKRLKMTLAEDKTFQLWSGFMPRRKEIKHSVSSDFISMQVYTQPMIFKDFTPHTEFEKWAAVEVSEYENIPDEMETYILNGGLYAVFIHKGLAGDFPQTAQYIFGSWLPNAEYELDQREHFELLGSKYKNNDPSSEEEVWIPIKKRKTQ